MEEPPQDDDLHLYIISTEDDSWDDVTKQLFQKYSLEISEYTFNRVKSLLESQSYNTIIDSWDSGEVVYQLHRLDREYFEPIMDFYVTQYSNMESLRFDVEDNIESEINALNYTAAINSLIELINNLLIEESEINALVILRLLDELLSLYDNFSLEEDESFTQLTSGEAVGDKRWSFLYTGEIDYNELTYVIRFSEGWNQRERSLFLPIKDGQISFTPVSPEVKGTYKLEGELYLKGVEDLITKGFTYDYLAPYLSEFRNKLEKIRTESKVSLEYTVISNFHSSSKVISFNNDFIHEGIRRYLLEEEYEVLISPRPREEETRLNYIRDINRITSDSVRYLIMGSNLVVEEILLDEGAIYRLGMTLEVINLRTSQTVFTQSLESEFLADEGRSDLAYLDFGLKLGEVIYTLEF